MRQTNNGNDSPLHEDIAIENNVDLLQSTVLRRSQRKMRPAISDDYVVYLQEPDFDIGINKDPISFSQAIESDNFSKWIKAMDEC